MTQIFSHWLFKSHRFHGFTQIFFFFLPFLYFADFRPVGLGGCRRFLLLWTRKGLYGFSLVLFFPCHFFFFLSFLLFFCHFFISQILDLSVWEDDADFWFHELEKDYADFSNSLFFLFWIHWFLYIINLLIRHFSDPYFFTSFVLFPYFLTSFFL